VLLRVSHEKALHSTGDPRGARGGIQKVSGEVFLECLLSSFESNFHWGRVGAAGGDMAGYFLNLSIPFTVIVLGFGGFLLHDSVSSSGPWQLQEVIGGALLLALGLISAYPQLRFAIRWMQDWRAQNN
jgi:hypothetical protein